MSILSIYLTSAHYLNTSWNPYGCEVSLDHRNSVYEDGKQLLDLWISRFVHICIFIILCIFRSLKSECLRLPIDVIYCLFTVNQIMRKLKKVNQEWMVWQTYSGLIYVCQCG